MKRATAFSIVLATLITQSTGAAERPPAMGGQAFAPRPTAPPAPTWGRPVGSNPDGESWDDSRENYIGADAGGEEEVASWLRFFDLVVVIDKADQSILAYRNAGTKEAPVLKLALQSDISSGDEKRDCHFEMSTTPDHQGAYWAVSTSPMHKHTPTGYFVPTAVKADYYSKKYRSNMENAVAWLEAEGYYTHKFPEGTKKELGTPASHGCIRLGKEQSQDLATMVLMTGAPFDPARDMNLRASCWQDENPQAPRCTPDPVKDHDLLNYFTNAKNGIFPRNLKANLPRTRTYNDRPDVLVVHRNGIFETDSSGRPLTQKANFNTLYIVKDSNMDPAQGPNFPAPISCGAEDLRKENAKIAASYKKYYGKAFNPPPIDERTTTVMIQPRSTNFFEQGVRDFFKGF